MGEIFGERHKHKPSQVLTAASAIRQKGKCHQALEWVNVKSQPNGTASCNGEI